MRPPDAPPRSGFLTWHVPFVAMLLRAGTFGHFAWVEEVMGTSDELARTVAISVHDGGRIVMFGAGIFVIVEVERTVIRRFLV
jgi:hypothetical protein